MASVLIIGAGWLGRPLAKQLSASHHQVDVTNSQLDTVKQSSTEGLHAHHLSLPLEAPHSLTDLLQQLNTDTIIGCFTPGFRRTATPNWDSYAQNWQQICQSAKQAKINKIIMISSTAVYPAIAKPMQESDADFAQSIVDNQFSEKSRALLKAEQQVLDSGLNYAVIRCSGLIDQHRHPSRFATRLRSVSRHAPANMLHKDDAIGIIEFALNKVTDQVLNASTPDTCDKAQFYQAAIASRQLDIALPEIVDTPDKRIDSTLSQKLGYQYRYQHTLDLL
ncbi:hypothetical protein VHA01S_018_00440 [Vibrio halioticoli NBRC 102217]|uniref:NAD(P)-binding domain-containing protein n=1 Tax=Vibrio halioticoli NBRC 102217 TaxID=1219072 RepID=V5HIV3_9VIBR|nr:NAD(P)H-binding protein [Vibrio halioticoli]GAD89255.1 hypothetical protein VHA01S_018_00440 [Vibrio halioticoli NBRC 102217]